MLIKGWGNTLNTFINLHFKPFRFLSQNGSERNNNDFPWTEISNRKKKRLIILIQFYPAIRYLLKRRMD